jgi:hypothetical protein
MLPEAEGLEAPSGSAGIVVDVAIRCRTFAAVSCGHVECVGGTGGTEAGDHSEVSEYLHVVLVMCFWKVEKNKRLETSMTWTEWRESRSLCSYRSTILPHGMDTTLPDLDLEHGLSTAPVVITGLKSF